MTVMRRCSPRTRCRTPGELRFAKQALGSKPFLSAYENPIMILLKPGYAPLYLQSVDHLFPTPAEASRWEYEGQTVRMKTAVDDPYHADSYLLRTYTGMAAAVDPPCGWKNIAKALVAADRVVPDPGDTLRTLLMNDALYVQQGCGSPAAFFAPYLR